MGLAIGCTGAVVRAGEVVVHVIDAPGDHGVNLHDAGWISGELFLAGKIRDKGDDGDQEKKTRLFVMAVGDDGRPRWTHRFDAMRNNLDHIHAVVVSAYDHLSGGKGPPKIGVWFRAGEDTFLRLVLPNGRPSQLIEVGRIEESEGGWVQDAHTTYLVGGGSFRGGRDAWVAQINRKEEVAWKTPIRFEGLPSGLLGRAHVVDQKWYHITAADDVIESPDGTLLVAGAHRVQTNKFGGGASDRFVARFTSDGRELARAVLPHRFSEAKPAVAEVDGSVYTVQTTRGFEGITEQRHEITLACFDQNLSPRWEQELTDGSRFSSGEAIILPTGDDAAPLMIATPVRGAVRLTWCTADGAVVSQRDVDVPMRVARPIRGLLVGTDAVIVATGFEQVAVVRVPLNLEDGE